MTGDLLRDIHPAADRHGALGEVTEFVGEDRLQLAEIEHVDQAEPDLEILPGGNQEVRQRQVVEHARVHAPREKYTVRSRRAGFVRQAVQEFEQDGLLGRCDLQILDRLTAFDEDQRLEHENGQKGRRRAPHDVAQDGIAVRVRQGGQQTVRRPPEPTRQREIDGHKKQQAAGREPGLAAIVATRDGQVFRDRSRPAGVDDVHAVDEPNTQHGMLRAGTAHKRGNWS